MNDNSVVFIAFEEDENLGVRYMSAVLSEAGNDVVIIDFRRDNPEILEYLITLNPLLVGFSVIYENRIYEFKELIETLRNNGIHCHFTAGGHFASLSPDDLFEIIPDLDSIVRFEGEHTLVDLVDHLQDGADWKEVIGISYMKDGLVVNNQLRPLEPDLDVFPFPIRSEIKEYALDKKYATILAGRGCIYNCIYCNTREFFRQPPGPIKRIRNPIRVAEEIEYLHKDKDCSVFLFEDDDFPVTIQNKSQWISDFCKALQDKDLTGKILWKINCRPDEIHLESFELMKQHGIFKVFLGIEDGTDSGLIQLNKHLTVSANLKGINILKKLGIGIDFGFMLFQPSTTFNSFRENLKFLELICSDGYMPVTYLKMMPYHATKIKEELSKQGRLKGRAGFLDYDFYDKSTNDFYEFVSDCFDFWLNSPEGLLNISKWANIYLSVFQFFNGTIEGVRLLSDELRALVKYSNRFILDSLHEISVIFESDNYNLQTDQRLHQYRSEIEHHHKTTLESVTRIIGKTKMFSFTSGVFI